MASLFDELKSEIAKGHVTAIVGAGVSIGATKGDPLASWTGLLENGVDRCVEVCQPLPPRWEKRRKDEIASYDFDELLSAAENVSRKLGAPGGGEYRSWLRDTVGSLRLQDGAVIEALRGLGVTLATTNYDGLLDDPPGLPPVTWRDGARVERVVRGDDRGIFHLHGYWEEPESVILGIRSYEQVLGDAHAQVLQQALRTTRTLLFVGCGEGLADPNFGALRKWSRKVFKDSEYRHFRLCLDSELASLRKEHSPEERIFPISYGAKHDELAEFLRSLKPAAPSHSLPVPASTNGNPRLPGLRNCFGRKDQLRDLVDSVCADPPPPVPVLGQAGIGKSTVVIAALHHPRVKARYGQRRFFVGCDGATDRESLVGEIARGLGVEEGPGREARLFSVLEQSPLVLALDDAETPYWAETAAVEKLLSQLGDVPGLALVISLRGEQRPLGPRWREAIRLVPLPKTPATEAFLAVAGARFQDDPNLEELLRAVDGWPLALTLLAHQAEIEPDLSSLLKLWVAKRTELLRLSDDKSRLNVDVSLDLSINSPRMTGDSRRLLSLLGVLPEGVVRERLNAFFPEALSAAAVLRQVGLALDDGGRVRALAPVREYVREKHTVSRDDLQNAVSYYLRWAQETQQSLEDKPLEFSQHMAQEFGNLEALVITSLTPPVADSDSTADTSEKIRSILSLGSLLSSTGLSKRAPHIVGKALQRAEDIGDQRLKIDCLILLGDIARVHANLVEARRHFTASVELSRQIVNVFLEAVGLSKLGAVEQGLSNLSEARRCYEEANGLFAREHKTEGQGICLLGLANIHFDNREFDAADAKAQEAVGYFSHTTTQLAELGKANCLNFLGEIALETDDLPLAKERIATAQEIYVRRASSLGRANCLKNLARVELKGRDYKAAAASFNEALDLYKVIVNWLGEADCLQGLGDLKQVSDPEAAQAQYRKALELYTRVRDPFLIGRIHRRLSRVATQESEYNEHIEAARAAWNSIGRRDLVEELRQDMAVLPPMKKRSAPSGPMMAPTETDLPGSGRRSSD